MVKKDFAQKKFREFCPSTPNLTTTNDSVSSKNDGGLSYSYTVTFEGKKANTVTAPDVISSDLKL